MRTIAPDIHARVRERIAEQQRQSLRRALDWLIAFCAMFATDLFWASYVAAIKNGLALHASLWAVALFLVGAVAVLGYTRNRWLLIPAALGAFFGTLAGVLWH